MKNWLLGAAALCSANFLGAQALSVTMDKIDPTCWSYTNGIAIANPTGGVLPYAFHWENGQAGSQNWGLPVGKYAVTVTDAAGHSVVSSVTLVQPAKMVVDVAAVNVECADFQGTLTASAVGGTPPYNYAWSTGTPSQTTFIAGQGDYLVTVLDSKACHDVGTRYVNQPSEIFPNIIVQQPQTMQSNDGSITVQSIGNHLPHAYKWTTGATAPTLTNLGPGTFKVSITDQNLCTKVETVVLNALISLDVSVQVTNSVCFNQNNGAVGAFVTGGIGPFSFSWTNAAGTFMSDQAIVQNLAPGTYTVVVTDGDGNQATASGTVTEPTQLLVGVTVPPANCGNGTYTVPVSISGGTPPYMITNNGVAVGSLPLTGLLPGSYNYLCVMDANKCQLDVPFYAPENVNLTANLVVSSATCAGNPTGTATVVVSGGSGNYSYNWSAPAFPLNTPSQNGLPPGPYSVTITDNVNGCTAVATGSIGQHTNIAVFISTTDALCIGQANGSATASASNGTAPYAFDWGSLGANPTISSLAAGSYPVTVTDATGCSTVSVANIGAQIVLDAAFMANTLGCAGDNVEVQFVDQSTQTNQINNWSWSFTSGTNGVSTFDGQNPPNMTFSKNQNITVQLTVSNSNGCSDLQSSVVEITGQPIVVAPASVGGCNDAAITLVPDQTFYSYSWSGPNGFVSSVQNPTVTASGTYLVTVTAAPGCSIVKDVTATISPDLGLAAVETPVNNCDNSSSLTASANGAGTTFSWLVNGVLSTQTGTTFSTSNLPNGLSQIIVKADGGGCLESDTIMVEARPVDISLSGNQTPCVNQNAMVEVTGLDPTETYDFIWSPAAPNGPQAPIPTPAPGQQNFAVTVTNSVGCTDVATFSAMVSAGDDLTDNIKIKPCNGREVTFEINATVPGTWFFGNGDSLKVTSGQSPIIYTYPQNGTFTAQFIPSVPCVTPFSKQITAADLVVDANFTNASVGPCDSDILLSFKSTSTGGSTFLWNFGTLGPNQTTPNPTDILVSQNGTFPVTLTVTDANGCSDTFSKDVTLTNLITPLPSLVDQTYCESMSAIGLNPGGNPSWTYEWSGGLPGVPNPLVITTSSQTYFVTVSSGPCSVKDTVSITVNAQPSLTAAPDQTLCSTAPVTLSASSDGAIKWSLNPNFIPSTDGQNFTVSPTATGTTTVYVEATSIEGCKKVDQILLINGQPNIDFDLAPKAICKGSSTQLAINQTDPTDQPSVSWSPAAPNELNATVAPATTTTYTATVTNQPSGCTATASFTVEVIDLQAQIINTMKDTLCPNESTQFDVAITGGPASGTYSFEWSGTNLDNDAIKTPTASPNMAGQHNYMVYVTLDQAPGCKAQSTIYTLTFVDPQCAEPYIFLPNAFTPNDNDGDPHNDILFVRASAEISELLFVIYDRWGEEVFRTTDKNKGWDGTFKGEILTPDSYGYYLKAKCAGGENYYKQGNVTLLR